MFEEAGEDLATGQSQVAIALRMMPDFGLLISGVESAPPLREQRVIAALAILSRRVSRATLAHLLWPDVRHEQALTSLRSTLAEMRRRPAAQVIDDNGATLALHRWIRVDWSEARNTAVCLTTASCGTVSASTALVILAHPLLTTWDDLWVAEEQRAFDELRAQALESLSRRLQTEGAYALAGRTAAASVLAGPLRESAYAALIDAQLAEGNRAAAIATFRSLARVLRDELGVEPSFPFRGE